MVPVVTPSGDLPICVNLKKVNQAAQRGCYVIPWVVDIIHQLPAWSVTLFPGSLTSSISCQLDQLRYSLGRWHHPSAASFISYFIPWVVDIIHQLHQLRYSLGQRHHPSAERESVRITCMCAYVGVWDVLWLNLILITFKNVWMRQSQPIFLVCFYNLVVMKTYDLWLMTYVNAWVDIIHQLPATNQLTITA